MFDLDCESFSFRLAPFYKDKDLQYDRRHVKSMSYFDSCMLVHSLKDNIFWMFVSIVYTKSFYDLSSFW